MGVGLEISLQPSDILLIYWHNQLKKYITPSSKTSEGDSFRPPSDVYIRSFLCPFSYFNKTATKKLLSDRAWSLVPKLNLESDTISYQEH